MTLTVKRPETRVPFCLDGDLKAAHEAAEAEYARENNRRMADPRLGSTVRKLAEKVQDLESQMQDSTVTFLIRGLKRGEWVELTGEHPPREKNTLDASYGYNVEAVMLEGIPRSIVAVENSKGEPLDFDPAAEWDALAEDMTNSQYEDFILAVLKVNAGRNDVPFFTERLQGDAGFRAEVTAAHSLGISLKRFHGWEPETVYTYEGGRLISSKPEAEWDDREQSLVLAMHAYKSTLCPLCGLPVDVCTDPKNERKFKAGQPIRCHKTTAELISGKKIDDKMPHKEALLFSAEMLP
ncbi:tail assembly chaperone [Arthrobacter phage MidnightRain]|nr:tail assembly chaperone [Arthrobacter phage MidnightRain]